MATSPTAIPHPAETAVRYPFLPLSANGLVENNLIYNIDDDGSTPLGGGNHIYRNNTFAGTITGWALENGLASNLFENNIFWVTNGNGAIQNTALGTFNYNDYSATVLPGTGNISSNPLFVSNYYLSHIAADKDPTAPPSTPAPTPPPTSASIPEPPEPTPSPQPSTSATTTCLDRLSRRPRLRCRRAEG